ncbi:hypothetical protein GCM10023063_19180 [Arthrobacter methylotrophus]|uniref:Uncharacterized protein n=1 Tax=Arthrobacter methylotrophus TaxID=121291 RepID=A0ABV5URS3_9MICC
MSTLTDTFMHRRPVRHRITVLDTDTDIHYFSHTTDNYPDSNGMYRRQRKDYTRDNIVLRGSYFIEELDEDGDREGRFYVLTPEEFREQFTEHEDPYFEYGVQFVPRPRDIVSHGGDLKNAREALKAMPVLAESGEYAIVRRLVTEPGPWERFD